MIDDNYSHQNHTLMYVTESVPGPPENSKHYNQIVEDFNSQLTKKCDCNNLCELPCCPCVKQSDGSNYVPSLDTDILYLNESKLKDGVMGPILECNDLCSCSYNCGNRLVQRGPHKSLYVGMSCNEKKGLGLFCNNFIQKGTFVCEYAGEVITKAQAISRQPPNIVNKEMNYIFCLNEHSVSGISQTFVDPSEFGNIGRYANHSCDPNCVIVPVRVNIPIPKLALFACKDIPPHSEVTFHYGSPDRTSDLVEEDVVQKKCLCGTAKCKGWMPYQKF
ncbi:histone-lysine N-methyltransferase SETMAR [Ostrinia furnacalis]|uniref:histone-lysine N-methyltransferase SETMAR n=1 Tax=Ostrinia furnacalis TaxID=93504 RepID=UPI001039DA4D|nr:histone-lysine N-methyltransferase SETMAR [Ostrinia furnacalis]